MNMIYSSLDKEPVLTAKAEVINLGAPNLANQRLMAAYINELLDTCEIDSTPSVLDFADKFIGDPIDLTEGALMMQLYENMTNHLATKLAEQIARGDYSTTNPEILAGYRIAHLFHRVMSQGFGLTPFKEHMTECLRAAVQRL